MSWLNRIIFFWLLKMLFFVVGMFVCWRVSVCLFSSSKQCFHIKYIKVHLISFTEDRCAEEDLSVFDSNTAVLMIPLNNLTESSQYVFAAIVSAERREPIVVQQTVHVLPGEPPQLDIR